MGGGVNAEFFNNTAFLGDSRVEGLSYYCGSDVPGASFFTSRGIMLDGVSSKKANTTTTGQQLTMIEALGQKQYKKVYMMFGVNELGWPYEDVFQRHYEDVIKLVKQSQPGAEIYVMGIFPVTAKKSSSGTIYTNEKIDRFDARVKAAAAACNVHYISVRPALVDESGVLPAAASSDGVHLNAQYCYKWLNYLSKNS